MSSINNLIRICLLLLLAITIASFFGKVWWLFDVLAHLRLQYTFFATLGLTALILLNFIQKYKIQRFYILIACVLIVLNLYPVANFYKNAPKEIYLETGTPTMRVMSLNVFSGNKEYQKVMEIIQHENPDVLLLMEVNDSWEKQLRNIEAIYPHKIVVPRPDNFGIALYSKHPLIISETHEWGAYHIPSITATVLSKDSPPVHVIGIHTMPPLNDMMAQSNRAQLQEVSKHALKTDGPVVIMGDFNATPWSYSYQSVFSGNDFYHAWGDMRPIGTWLPNFIGGIFIDHILVKNMIAMDWKVSEDVGSDHRAISANIQARKNK